MPLFDSHKSETLVIVGNGFDLHHILKTKNSDFRAFLHENNSQIYDALESLHDACGEKDNEEALGDFWGDFETNLANPSYQANPKGHADYFLYDYINNSPADDFEFMMRNEDL